MHDSDIWWFGSTPISLDRISSEAACSHFTTVWLVVPPACMYECSEAIAKYIIYRNFPIALINGPEEFEKYIDTTSQGL
jgi:hypothetical protein